MEPKQKINSSLFLEGNQKMDPFFYRLELSLKKFGIVDYNFILGMIKPGERRFIEAVGLVPIGLKDSFKLQCTETMLDLVAGMIPKRSGGVKIFGDTVISVFGKNNQIDETIALNYAVVSNSLSRSPSPEALYLSQSFWEETKEVILREARKRGINLESNSYFFGLTNLMYRSIEELEK